MGSFVNNMINPFYRRGKPLKQSLTTKQSLFAVSLVGMLLLIPGIISAQTDIDLFGSAATENISPQSSDTPAITDDSAEISTLTVEASSQSASTPSQNQSQNQSSVTINGNAIPVPQSGVITREIKTPSSNTKFDISIDNNSSASTESHSNTKTNIEVHSHSSSSQSSQSDPRSQPRR